MLCGLIRRRNCWLLLKPILIQARIDTRILLNCTLILVETTFTDKNLSVLQTFAQENFQKFLR